MPTTPSSCISKNALIELGNGDAPKLDYKLPQTNGFTVNLPFEVQIDQNDFVQAPGIRAKPLNNYYDKVNALGGSMEDRATILSANLGNVYVINTASQPVDLVSAEGEAQFITATGIDSAAVVSLGTTAPNNNILIAGNPISAVGEKAAYACPVVSRDLSGQEYISYVPEPPAPVPHLYIIEHYRVETYLGNYGAGETVKTFSLLPGEKTTISIKTYKQSQTTRKDSRNVLDSFDKETATELERMLMATADSSVTRDRSGSISDTMSLSATIPVKAATIGASNTRNLNASAKTIRADALKLVNKVIGKQVQKSVSSRKIDVETEITRTETSSMEQSIVRVLENINKSRVLNFVFRQLNQQLITVTYLEDVSFLFMNGYPESTRRADLATLKDLIDEIIVANKQTQVFNDIINHLHNIEDCNGASKSYIKKETISYHDIFTQSVNNVDVYVQDTDITMNIPETGSFTNNGQDITIKGIITDISQRVVPTDSLIVDALLGQGEALDCFNLKLQDAAVMSAQLENSEKQQALDIIDHITDNTEKANLYKKVFTNCCDVPQVGCNCGAEGGQ